MADRQKIMVVDDELDILRSTQMLVQQLGYECVTLPDARKVVEVAGKEHPDLILQDLRMPNIDIPKLVKGLKDNPATAKIPLVFFSASPDVAKIAAENDVSGFLPKPFGEQQLTQVLIRALGKQAAPMEKKATGKEALRQAVTIYFHDYWNTLTALNNYTEFLLNSQNLAEPEKEAAEEMNRLILDLEHKTDALRSHLLSSIG